MFETWGTFEALDPPTWFGGSCQALGNVEDSKRSTCFENEPGEIALIAELALERPPAPLTALYAPVEAADILVGGHDCHHNGGVVGLLQDLHMAFILSLVNYFACSPGQPLCSR